LHASGKRIRCGFFEPCGVDRAKVEIGDPGGTLAAVPGQSWRVVNKCRSAADEPVEQRRLSDIRPAEDGDRKAHRTMPRKFAAKSAIG